MMLSILGMLAWGAPDAPPAPEARAVAGLKPGVWLKEGATYRRGDKALEGGAFHVALLSRRPALFACLPEGQKASTVALDFTFDAKGMSTVEVDGEPDVAACAEKAVLDLEVPAYKKGSTVSISVVLGDPEGQRVQLGSLKRDDIDAVIKQKLKRIRACYQRQLVDEPTLSGKLVVKFVIEPDGSVGRAQVKKESTTLSNDRVPACIVNTFKGMQFPPPKGGGIVIVTYPFIFAPG